jgi:hypothetical protein
MNDWNNTETLVLLALLVGLLVGTFSGYVIVIDHFGLAVDNVVSE